MTDLSRRKFMTRTTVGAAVVATVVSGVGGARLLTSVPAEEGQPLDLTPLGEHMVAHVRDVNTGEIAVFAGHREVVFRDPRLVAELLKNTRSELGRSQAEKR